MTNFLNDLFVFGCKGTTVIVHSIIFSTYFVLFNRFFDNNQFVGYCTRRYLLQI